MTHTILVLDEPNSGLDVTTSLVLRSLVHAFAAEGRMVVCSSHVLETVEHIATDVLILQDGCVAAHGSVGDLRRMMASPTLDRCSAGSSSADVDGLARTLMDVLKT
jgi:ABC-2 type transport system ATP-binding protein